MDKLDKLKQLEPHCSFEKDRLGGLEKAYLLTFKPEQAVTTIRIVFDDSSGADMAITNMTTLPETQTRKGHGSKTLQTLLRWALDNKLYDIRAVQVQRESEPFWTKNGFVRLGNQTNDFAYKGGV